MTAAKGTNRGQPHHSQMLHGQASTNRIQHLRRQVHTIGDREARRAGQPQRPHLSASDADSSHDHGQHPNQSLLSIPSTLTGGYRIRHSRFVSDIGRITPTVDKLLGSFLEQIVSPRELESQAGWLVIWGTTSSSSGGLSEVTEATGIISGQQIAVRRTSEALSQKL